MAVYVPSFADVYPMRQALDDWTQARQKPKLCTDQRFAEQTVKFGDAVAAEAQKLIGVWVEALRLVEAATEEAA